MTRHRSAASLLASGVATITLDQRLRAPKLRTTADALRSDRKALENDGERALRHLVNDFSRI